MQRTAAARPGAATGRSRCIGAGRLSSGGAARATPDDAPSPSLMRHLRRKHGGAERPVWSGFATFKTHADAASGRREPNDRCWRPRTHALDPLLSFTSPDSAPDSRRSSGAAAIGSSRPIAEVGKAGRAG